MKRSEENEMKAPRVAALDRTKGLCVILMILFTGIGYFPAFGPLYLISASKRSVRLTIMPDVVLADLMLPFFLFVMGMSYVISFNRRASLDKKGAYLHFLKRYMVFLGLGSILVSAEYLLLKGKKDPLFSQTLFMFFTFGFALLYLVTKVFFFSRKKLLKVLRYGMDCSLAVLAVLGLVLAFRDDVLRFTMQEEKSVIYKSCYLHWSVLHSLGMAGLIGLLFVGLKWQWRMVAWAVFALLYGVVQSIPTFLMRFSVIVLGGLAGSFGWALVLVSGMVFFDLFLLKGKAHWPYLLALLVTLCFTFLTCRWLPSNSRGVSLNVVFLSISIFASIFYLESLADSIAPKRSPLGMLGKNPLLIFGLGLFMKVGLILWNPTAETSILWALLYFSLCGVPIFGIAYLLDKKGNSIHL